MLLYSFAFFDEVVMTIRKLQFSLEKKKDPRFVYSGSSEFITRVGRYGNLSSGLVGVRWYGG